MSKGSFRSVFEKYTILAYCLNTPHQIQRYVNTNFSFREKSCVRGVLDGQHKISTNCSLIPALTQL